MCLAKGHCFLFSSIHWPCWPTFWSPKPRPSPAPAVRTALPPQGPYLLTDKTETPVRPLTLVGLSQDGVKGLASCPVVRGGVGRDSKGGNVHLWEGQGGCHIRKATPGRRQQPIASRVWSLDAVLQHQGPTLAKFGKTDRTPGRNG